MSIPIHVPDVPGVPAVIFAPGAGEILSLLTQDVAAVFAGVLQLPWGIYLAGVPVVLADNVTRFAYQQEYQISDFPVEGGEFESYNKVYVPFQGQFRFTAGGSMVNRQKLLDSLGAIIGDTNLYDIVTEDAIYTSVNLVRMNYDRSALSGLGLLAVDVLARQVRVAPSLSLFNVTNPSDALQVNGGVVQAINPTQAQQSLIPLIDTL